MKFTDTVSVQGVRRREDGYLVVDARVARTGLQRYLGSEVGKPELEFVDVLRPEAEVFSTDAMASFAHRPLTDDHPREAVTSKNWKQLAVGQTDGDIKRDGDFLRVPLMVADGEVIDKIEGGKRELSAGYTCDLVWGDGVTADGHTYQATQTNIRANHVAVVQRGRAGKDVRIGDGAEAWGTSPIMALDKEVRMTTRTVMVDGYSVETTDNGAQAINKLLGDRKDLQDKLASQETAHAKALADSTASISKLQAQLDAAKEKVLDAAGISKLVADRVALEATAAQVAKDVKPAGLSDADLKRAVVKAKRPDLAADKLADDAYVSARFDQLAEDAEQATDTVRDAARRTKSTQSVITGDAAAARQQAFDDLLYFDTHGVERPVN